jgi:hypothetical protein
VIEKEYYLNHTGQSLTTDSCYEDANLFLLWGGTFLFLLSFIRILLFWLNPHQVLGVLTKRHENGTRLNIIRDGRIDTPSLPRGNRYSMEREWNPREVLEKYVWLGVTWRYNYAVFFTQNDFGTTQIWCRNVYMHHGSISHLGGLDQLRTKWKIRDKNRDNRDKEK